MSEFTNNLLTCAVRQFKHNDGSAGFVFGYDMPIVDKLVAGKEAKIEELEQQLAELSEKYIQVEALAAQYALEAGKVDLIDLMKELQSPALVNQMKAKAVREAVEALDPVASIRKLKSMAEVEGMAAYRHEVLDYAKQLEQTKT